MKKMNWNGLILGVGFSFVIALLAKLSRVFLLVPLCFILIFWVKNKTTGSKEERTQVSFPYFLLGFIAMSLFGSYGIGTIIDISFASLDIISEGTTFLLSAAMVGLGVNVSLQAIREKACKPLLAMFLASILLSVVILSITLATNIV